MDSYEDADEKETLLAFSYLFVPLLILGMEGEKEREQVIDALTLIHRLNHTVTVTNQHRQDKGLAEQHKNLLGEDTLITF